MLDTAIYLYLLYMLYKLIGFYQTGDSLVALSLNKDNLYSLILLFALIALDLLIDYTRKDAQKRSKLAHDYLRLAMVILAGVGIFLFNNYRYESHDPYTTNSTLSWVDREILKDYAPISEEAGIIEERIYNDFGVRVYTGINPSDYLNLGDYISYPSTNAQKSEQYLLDIYNALSVYSDEALSHMPKRMFIIDSVNVENIAGINYDRISPENNFIILCDHHNNNIHTIHHEIFHTLNVYTDEKVLQDFSNNEEACELTSSYACTNSIEFAAESWAYALTDHKYTQHSEILESAYSSFLKGFSSDIEASEGDYVELIKNTNDVVYINNFNEEYYQMVYKTIFSDDPCSFLKTYSDYISDGQSAIIYKNERTIDQNEYDRLYSYISEITESYSSYSGVMKILRIYEHLNKLEYSEDYQYFYELLHSTFNSHYIINQEYDMSLFKTYCMFIALKQLDYDVECFNYYSDTNQGYLFIKQDIDEYSYIYDFTLEKPGLSILLGFMVAPDDYRYYHPDIPVLDYYSYDNDRRYGDYSRVCLLDSFDKNIINNYVVSMYRKYGLKSELVFVSYDSDVINNTFDYLHDQGDGKHSTIQILYNRYINSYYYPGYNSYHYDNIYYVFDF